MATATQATAASLSPVSRISRSQPVPPASTWRARRQGSSSLSLLLLLAAGCWLLVAGSSAQMFAALSARDPQNWPTLAHSWGRFAGCRPPLGSSPPLADFLIKFSPRTRAYCCLGRQHFWVAARLAPANRRPWARELQPAGMVMINTWRWPCIVCAPGLATALGRRAGSACGCRCCCCGGSVSCARSVLH